MDQIVFENDDIIKALIIEDNRTVQKAITLQLEKSSIWKFDLSAVDNMTDALTIKQTGNFNIVLADLVLPDSDRISTLNILRNEFTELPFVILTATDDDNLLIQSIEAGAENYLCKDVIQQGALLSRTLYNAIQHWKMRSELKYMASHDDLTGALNKRFFLIELQNMIESSKISGTPFCLAICDLDDFREVNNSYGHVAGDRALKIFVREIQSVTRNQDIVARFGGDEFCILFPGTDIDKCAKYLKKLSALTHKVQIDNENTEAIHLKSSYGAALFRKGMNAEQLLKLADKVLYEVKKHGKGYSKVV